MRLISCYIENFGKISNKTFEFNNGLNCICEENGWGKSTLATFIRVMFYGFLNEKARKGVANERKRFKPWQGGAYGGKLSFESDGKVYEIERTFGGKEAEDTFILRDKSTNLLSNDYTKNIGEELFKIDVHSFMRTAYISQNDCLTNTTDGINAKIGNLAENTDDINNFENVDKRLLDLINSMSPTRKTGSIARLKDEMNSIMVDIKNGSVIDNTIDEYTLMRDEKIKELDSLKNRQAELSLEKRKISRLNDDRILKERYKGILEDYSDKKRKSDILRGLFKNIIPDVSDVDKAIDESHKLSIYENSMKIYTLSDEEKTSLKRLRQVFDDEDNIPDKAELDDKLNKVSQLQRINVESAQLKITSDEEERFAELDKHFGGEVPKDSEIDTNINRIMSRNEKKSSLEARKAALVSMKSSIERENNEKKRQEELAELALKETKEKLLLLENESESNKKKRTVFAFVGGGLILVGIILTFILQNKIYGVTTCVPGIVFLIFAYMSYAGIRKIEDKIGLIKAESERNADRQSGIAVIEDDSVELLEREITEDELFIEKSEEEISAFIEKYYFDREQLSDVYVNDTIENAVNILYSIKSDANEYKRLFNKKEKSDNGKFDAKIKNISSEIYDFIGKYYDTSDITLLQFENALHSIRKDADSFKELFQKEKNFIKAEKNYNESLRYMKEFMSELSMDTDETESLGRQLVKLKGDLQQYQDSKRELEISENVKLQFETKYREDIRRMNGEDLSLTYSMEEIDNQMENNISAMEEIRNSILHYNNQLNEFREKRDDISEKEKELEQLEDKYKEDLKKYKLIKLTRELLEKAKNSFTAKYMEPVMSGFLKYYNIIDGGDTSVFHIDAQTKITIDEQGSQRDTEVLSMGRQDLIGICMRMALVNAMYEEEKPFVIFDDPFVNLDDERVKGGIELMKKISDEYQIVYFTCHESRS